MKKHWQFLITLVIAIPVTSIIWFTWDTTWLIRSSLAVLAAFAIGKLVKEITE